MRDTLTQFSARPQDELPFDSRRISPRRLVHYSNSIELRRHQLKLAARRAQFLNPGREWFGALDRHLTHLRTDATGRGTATPMHRRAFLVCKLPRAFQPLAPRQFGTRRRVSFAVLLNDFRSQA